MRVCAVVASDPWICGYDLTRHGITTAPTLALCTQSMMWPPNDEAVGRVLESIGQRAGARAGGAALHAAPRSSGVGARGIALYAEAVETRHQKRSLTTIRLCCTPS